ncbi:Sec-independent protein translocase protein TatB [Sulfurospirillum deleyianum]|uniref:Sec-independent protein translocase protein TatB homolog n=1 Tax=Sulfurospirillum deleyianum (strain ATCC 51133 / DSM 6946 / 5175) TaxID=525898 RepID=D1B300_SULD5|nr:Sec-independent protein translocase protein TatB [Sulfurospirillum deleyianum]ACZ12470.1 twin-arginine translocation protein, TatB subunit [Sulfurospirillum deleyianum DSM 6946]
MFGLGISELLIIAIIAIIFLGPEKLPEAMVKGAKFFKTFKNSINDVKSSFEQEMKIQELKEEALTYKKKLDEAATSARKVISFDELEEIKKTTQGVNDSLKELENSVKESVSHPTPISSEETKITTAEALPSSTASQIPETKKEVTA